MPRKGRPGYLGVGVTISVGNSALGARNPDFQGLPPNGLSCDLTKCVALALGPQFPHKVTVKGGSG